MRKVKTQVTEGLWTTDWWELAEGLQAVVRMSQQGKCSIKLSASAPSTLHEVNRSLPAHWQKDQSTDVTKALAVGQHDLKHLLRSGGITMQADKVEDWAIEVESSEVEAVLRAIADNYERAVQ